MITNDIEDFLSDNEVFVSGIDGRPTDMDSYMTIIDFGALRTAMKLNTFKKEDWQTSIDIWRKHQKSCPIAKILAETVEPHLVESTTMKFPE